MTKLILKLLTKQDITSIKGRESVGKSAGALGVVCNIFLSGLKFFVGVATNSIAITADAFNNLADAGSSVITFVGFRLSGKPADRDHPYGHARYEYIAGLVVSFLVLIIGLNTAKSSIIKIVNPEKILFSYFSLVVLSVSILVKLWMALFYRSLGRTINSDTLDAAAVDSRNDCISTFAVLVSTVISKYSDFETDGIFGLLVSVFILYSGFRLIKETSDPLLGQAPDAEVYSLIEKRILSYDKVLGIHDLIVHNYGPRSYFASVHVEVDYLLDSMTSHDLLDEIERDFKDNHNIHLVAHLDPIVTDNEAVNELQSKIKDIVTSFDCELSIHDFRVVFGSNYKNVIFDVLLPPEYKYKDFEIKQILEKHIAEKFEEKIYVILTIDHSYGL
ncbi:MAG: Ferrous-iron efflux pump FieF [Firmicutes bacterium ADurb.Bin300]|nr:MAG: Ferrous-iron efflux pump FieF [Firmicutes bacterium ADurb.Bin300]